MRWDKKSIIWTAVLAALILIVNTVTVVTLSGLPKPYDGGAMEIRDPDRVIVEKGAIRVCDADCPDKICEERGAISKAGQTIVCLPNRIVIKVLGKGEVEAIT